MDTVLLCKVGGACRQKIVDYDLREMAQETPGEPGEEPPELNKVSSDILGIFLQSQVAHTHIENPQVWSTLRYAVLLE